MMLTVIKFSAFPNIFLWSTMTDIWCQIPEMGGSIGKIIPMSRNPFLNQISFL